MLVRKLVSHGAPHPNLVQSKTLAADAAQDGPAVMPAALTPSPEHEIQANGGLADFWYLDDGDVMCDPRLVVPFLSAFDKANTRAGAVRNQEKTEVIYYATQGQLQAAPVDWRMEEVAGLARVLSAADPSVTLGVATGPAGGVRKQVEDKAKVVQAMADRIGVCSDAQTEHVMFKQSLGVCRLNLILRVHGGALDQQGNTLLPFREATRGGAEKVVSDRTETHGNNTRLGTHTR